MTLLEFEKVIQRIQGLWPRYSFPEDLQKAQFRYLRSFDVDDVVVALDQHHRDNPDARDPRWKMIMPWIREHAASVDRNEWRIFIDSLRRAAISQRVPGCRNMSDRDAFQRYLTANSHQHDYHGRSLPDPDGRRARLARWFRYIEGRRWTKYLIDINEPVPEWLLTEYDETVSCCTDEQREAG